MKFINLKICFYFFLLTVALILFPLLSQAQWSEDGVFIANLFRHWAILPGPDGGAWVSITRIIEIETFRTHVYRVDGEGNIVIDYMSILADTTHDTEMFGMLPSDDNSVLFIFRNYTLDPANSNSVYAQKISPEGERLFGPEGIPVAVQPTNQDHYPRYPTACTNGNGGAWFYYFHGATNRTTVCGINSEGEVVLEPTDIRDEDAPNRSVRIFPDEEGGFYIAYDNIYRRTLVEHFDANGDQIWSQPAVISPIRLDLIFFDLLPIPGQGFYMKNHGNTYLDINKFDINGEAVWDEQLHFIDGAYRTSNMLLAPDNGLLFAILATRDEFYNNIFRSNPDGSAYFDSTYMTVVDTSNLVSSSGLGLINGFEDNHYYYTHGSIILNPLHTRFRFRYLDSDYNDLWLENHLYLGENPEFESNGLEMIKASDSTIIVNLNLSANPSGITSLFLYKLNQNGQFAGFNYSVDEKPETPYQFKILSAYPNPFNSEVVFNIESQKYKQIELKIYNITGQLVDTIVQEIQIGTSQIRWKANSSLSTGIYFAQLKGGQESAFFKIVLLR